MEMQVDRRLQRVWGAMDCLELVKMRHMRPTQCCTHSRSITCQPRRTTKVCSQIRQRTMVSLLNLRKQLTTRRTKDFEANFVAATMLAPATCHTLTVFSKSKTSKTPLSCQTGLIHRIKWIVAFPGSQLSSMVRFNLLITNAIVTKRSKRAIVSVISPW